MGRKAKTKLRLNKVDLTWKQQQQEQKTMVKGVLPVKMIWMIIDGWKTPQGIPESRFVNNVFEGAHFWSSAWTVSLYPRAVNYGLIRAKTILEIVLSYLFLTFMPFCRLCLLQFIDPVVPFDGGRMQSIKSFFDGIRKQ